ncbi:MAG: glycosyltransferase [Spirochaetales bacterium]|nr:glycosyltransferase [Leptospiraceae bacterium]MCP5480135.1 glycosyltransferase [Spirochaetales bacterium]MCP5485525.1 glycosyltransferase [Spirochaetales bacterium]
MKRRVVQIAPGLNPGDAITNEIFLIHEQILANRGSHGFDQSAVVAEHIHPDLSKKAFLAEKFQPRAHDLIVFHFGVAANIVDRLLQWPNRRILVYHNVTPPEFFLPYSLRVAGRLARARQLLFELRSFFEFCIADSAFNARELERYGFADVRTLPVLFESNRSRPAPAVPWISAQDRYILFVGRLAPNKRHADLIKVMRCLVDFGSELKLVIAGGVFSEMHLYLRELQELTRHLGLEDRVVFTGHVSEDQLAALYGRAELFLSMSAHEGFCVPLLEAMAYDIPVLARGDAGSAVLETMDGAGIVFNTTDHLRIAALVAEVLSQPDYIARILENQRARLSRYDRRMVGTELVRMLDELFADDSTNSTRGRHAELMG